LYAAWFSLALNVVGALALGQAPLKLLRVYATFFMGAEALGQAANQGVKLFLALVLHSATGAVVGMPLYLVYHRRFGGHETVTRAINGVWLGVVMWLVNYYPLLPWFQPVVLGWVACDGEIQPYIIRKLPFWVAALTHIAFVEVVLLTRTSDSTRR
jgi:riboflavin transporter FmnP